MPRLFISYRRNDSADIVRRIHDSLVSLYGKNDVFCDTTSILPSQEFPARIDEALYSADILIVVIGKTWRFTESGEDLFENESDYVMQEVAAAIHHDLDLVVLLTGGAQQPTAKTLPEQLHRVAKIHSITIDNDANFHSRIDEIKSAINNILQGSPEQSSYIPNHPNDFLHWLQNFDAKAKEHINKYGIDQTVISKISDALHGQKQTEAEVARSVERTTRAKHDFLETEKLAKEKRENWQQLEAELQQHKESRENATLRAVTIVHPIAEKLRKHEDISDRVRKEFRIFGAVAGPTQNLSISPPSNLSVRISKNIPIVPTKRTDSVSWDAPAGSANSPQKYYYVVECARGEWFHGAPNFDGKEFRELDRTGDTIFNHEVSKSDIARPLMYRVKSTCGSSESKASETVIAR